MTTKIKSTSTNDSAPYCCTIDVVTRKLPSAKVLYPEARIQLLQLMEEDQLDRSTGAIWDSSIKGRHSATQRENARANKALAILNDIKTPSAQAIGLDGARALWLIALHNVDWNDLGIKVLAKMKQLYYQNKSQTFAAGIPYLVDRLMVSSKQFAHDARQRYGTQKWVIQYDDGKMESGTYPIISPNSLPKRLQKFGLQPKEKCIHTK